MLQHSEDVFPCACTIVHPNWSRDDKCNAAFSGVVNDREGRFMLRPFEGCAPWADTATGPITYLLIRNRHSIYSPPAPIKSWGQPGICQRLSQICPSSLHLSTSFTAPTVRLGYSQTASYLTKRKQWLQRRCALFLFLLDLDVEHSDFVSPGWDDCFSTNQHAAYSRSKCPNGHVTWRRAACDPPRFKV